MFVSYEYQTCKPKQPNYGCQRFSHMNFSVKDVRHIKLQCLQAGWLQNYINIIQTPNTFENRN